MNGITSWIVLVAAVVVMAGLGWLSRLNSSQQMGLLFATVLAVALLDRAI